MRILASRIWFDGQRLRDARQILCDNINVGEVISCRQHWFRFSFRDTWRAQALAGIRVDTTLGFTDRVGYRAGMVRPFVPYDHVTQASANLLEVPTVLMDTHLHYYGVERRSGTTTAYVSNLRRH